MAQLNIRLAPDHDAEFERWKDDLGVERGKLGKDIIIEALAARREGRAMFETPVTLGPGDMIAMQATLERGVMEIDRIATAWAKHEAGMHKLERDDQLALTRARNEFMAGLPDRIHASFNPIRKEMLALAERIDRQPRLDAIDDKQRELAEAVKANNLAIERWGKKPAVHNSYILWNREWPGGIIAAALSVTWLVCIASTVAIVMILPRSWLAVPSANLLLGGGDQAVCALVDYRMATDTCRTEFGGKAMTVTVKARPGIAAHRR